MADVFFREGDVAVKDFTLLSGTSAVDLTVLGATACVLRLKQNDGTYLALTCSILTPLSGIVRYSQAALDLLASKSPMTGYFEVVTSAGGKQDFPGSRDMQVAVLPKYV